MMEIFPLELPGSWLVEDPIFEDSRGSFEEWYASARLAEHFGYSLEVTQANFSISRRGAVRGIHFADVPPGQAKYLKCVRGAIFDVVVDVRVGSPTYMKWSATNLTAGDGRSIVLGEGLGHAFMALSDHASVIYMCSTSYDPDREHGISPLDAELGISWPDVGAVIMSEKDRLAPTLSDAHESGILPDYDACLSLAGRGAVFGGD
jgi:dTDP-4-dehydrorhamnose 3,5-epimerase